MAKPSLLNRRAAHGSYSLDVGRILIQSRSFILKGEKKYAALFDANVNNGSGPPNNRQNQGGPPVKGAKMAPAQRLQSALDKRAGR